MQRPVCQIDKKPVALERALIVNAIVLKVVVSVMEEVAVTASCRVPCSILYASSTRTLVASDNDRMHSSTTFLCAVSTTMGTHTGTKRTIQIIGDLHVCAQ